MLVARFILDTVRHFKREQLVKGIAPVAKSRGISSYKGISLQRGMFRRSGQRARCLFRVLGKTRLMSDQVSGPRQLDRVRRSLALHNRRKGVLLESGMVRARRLW
jgi:hypothetical protein